MNVIISDVSADFDRGSPFLFLVLEKQDEKKVEAESKGLNFMFKRLSFHSP